MFMVPFRYVVHSLSEPFVGTRLPYHFEQAEPHASTSAFIFSSDQRPPVSLLTDAVENHVIHVTAVKDSRLFSGHTLSDNRCLAPMLWTQRRHRKPVSAMRISM
jgi:hypothetical protein